MDFLDPSEDFNPQQWVFEQISLQMPLIKICGTSCPGPDKLNETVRASTTKLKYNDEEKIDPRWSELKKLL